MIEFHKYLQYFYGNAFLVEIQKATSLFNNKLFRGIKTTMIYTHVLNRGIGVRSPLD